MLLERQLTDDESFILAQCCEDPEAFLNAAIDRKITQLTNGFCMKWMSILLAEGLVPPATVHDLIAMVKLKQGDSSI